MSLPTNFHWATDLWKPAVAPSIQQRPLQLCPECNKPLPELRSVNMIVHPGACHTKRTKRIAARASKKQEARRKAKVHRADPTCQPACTDETSSAADGPSPIAPKTHTSN